jgi:prepilin signal peptidase PulO-like enzyme (type II secretory pathway)
MSYVAAGGGVFFAVSLLGRQDAIVEWVTLATVIIVSLCVIESDGRWLIIPDITWCLLLVCAAFRAQDFTTPLVGALTLAGLLAIVKYAYLLIRKVDGLGLGDIKLAIGVGALLGPQAGLLTITASSLATIMLLGLAQAGGRGAILVHGRPAAPFGLSIALTASIVAIADFAGWAEY